MPIDDQEQGESPASLLRPRRVVTQLVGFVIGAALLYWCIRTAIEGGDWSRLRSANPWLVVGLLGCTAVSLAANATSFWLVVRPVRPVGFATMQWLNLVAGILNYLPIRAGMIARVAFHLRIDRMSLLLIGGWFAAIGYTLALCVGACVLATIVRPAIDVWWAGLVVGQIVLGGWLTLAAMKQPIVVRYGRGMDRMLSDPAALWGAIGLRLLDIAAYIGRMACAAAILQLGDLGLSFVDITLLALAAMAMSINPLGRFGFREWAVTMIAIRLISIDMPPGEVDAVLAQLALVESAGEAMLTIPLGAVALVWFVRRWKRRRGAAA